MARVLQTCWRGWAILRNIFQRLLNFRFTRKRKCRKVRIKPTQNKWGSQSDLKINYCWPIYLACSCHFSTRNYFYGTHCCLWDVHPVLNTVPFKDCIWKVNSYSVVLVKLDTATLFLSSGALTLSWSINTDYRQLRRMRKGQQRDVRMDMCTSARSEKRTWLALRLRMSQ